MIVLSRGVLLGCGVGGLELEATVLAPKAVSRSSRRLASEQKPGSLCLGCDPVSATLKAHVAEAFCTVTPTCKTTASSRTEWRAPSSPQH